MEIIENTEKIEEKISLIAKEIVKEHLKGKIPLFVIGAGVSCGLKIPEKLKDRVEDMSVPDMTGMMDKLCSLYNDHKDEIPNEVKNEIDKLLYLWETYKQTADRSTVNGVLGYFQENDYLKKAWIEFNEWLLSKCVNETENYGIIEALPSESHDKIAELYDNKKVDAFCLTTNFDGLFYKALKYKYGVKAQSCYTKDQVTKFFTRTKERDSNEEKEYAEIQVRGDIFFVECDRNWCNLYDGCVSFPRLPEPIRIWELRKSHLMCERNEYRRPFISFPGSYAKDKETRDIISTLWQYLAYKVSCIITIGFGGKYDPILIAFLSDLSRERKIDFIDVNPFPNNSFIAKEIIDPKSSLPLYANVFMDKLNVSIDNAIKEEQNPLQYKLNYDLRDSNSEDKFWDEYNSDLEFEGLTEFEKKLLDNDLVKITRYFAQLGLKSKWWGVNDKIRMDHNRLNHAKGVMKVANFLYKKACKNSEHNIRAKEQQFLRIAALLHDIGHLPFSHLIEDVFQELNWKPGGYIESFTHDYYTDEKIREIFKNAALNDELKKIDYSVYDLISLINGKFGIGFLDAIVNGPIDADKIDYVFRDAKLAHVFPPLIEPKDFLSEIGEDIAISPEGLLILGRKSAEGASKVLQRRENLYKEFYLTASIRLLERSIKFIIVTYFVHKYNTQDIPEEIKSKLAESEFSDFGPIKIAMAAQELEKLSKDFSNSNDIEMKIVEYMKDFLNDKQIDERVKNAVRNCFDLINRVKGKKDCDDELKLRQRRLKISKFPPEEKIEEIRYNAKTVALRFPGAILIDVLPPFEFFTVSKERGKKLRSDGTNVQAECILIPDSSSQLNKLIQEKQSRKKSEENVFVYKIGEESEAKSALNLFERLIEGEKKLEEVE